MWLERGYKVSDRAATARVIALPVDFADGVDFEPLVEDNCSSIEHKAR